MDVADQSTVRKIITGNIDRYRNLVWTQSNAEVEKLQSIESLVA
jgi:hypothetical protein